ncbi:unnamed protein product [Musa acuminata var. zebrina]
MFADRQFCKWDTNDPKSFAPLISIYVAALCTGVIASAITEQLCKVIKKHRKRPPRNYLINSRYWTTSNLGKIMLAFDDSWHRHDHQPSVHSPHAIHLQKLISTPTSDRYINDQDILVKIIPANKLQE